MSNQKSKSIDAKCFCCGNDDLDRISLGKELIDSSNFYQQGEIPPKFHYQMTLCQDCGHVEIESDNPCWLSTRKHNFITYNEPTDHYPLIANLIRSIEIDLSDTSLHTFSYKDFNLVDYLREELRITDVQKNDHAKTSDFWLPALNEKGELVQPTALKNFLQEIETSQMKNKIVLITRFLDHANNIELINSVLNLCAKSAHLVFDINDYEKLFNSNTLEYIWNERRNFFVRDEIDRLAKIRGTRSLMLAYESQTTSPTIFGLLSNRISDQVQVTRAEDLEFSKPNVISRLKRLRERWVKALPPGSKLGVIGASHKGISLAQFIIGDDTQYSLHDDKEVLRGKIPPVDPPLGFHRVSDFDFSTYSHVAITTTKVIAAKIIPKLRASGFNGEILDFDCQILN